MFSISAPTEVSFDSFRGSLTPILLILHRGISLLVALGVPYKQDKETTNTKENTTPLLRSAPVKGSLTSILLSKGFSISVVNALSSARLL